MAFCIQCGAELHDFAQWCEKCGFAQDIKTDNIDENCKKSCPDKSEVYEILKIYDMIVGLHDFNAKILTFLKDWNAICLGFYVEGKKQNSNFGPFGILAGISHLSELDWGIGVHGNVQSALLEQYEKLTTLENKFLDEIKQKKNLLIACNAILRARKRKPFNSEFFDLTAVEYDFRKSSELSDNQQTNIFFNAMVAHSNSFLDLYNSISDIIIELKKIISESQKEGD